MRLIYLSKRICPSTICFMHQWVCPSVPLSEGAPKNSEWALNVCKSVSRQLIKAPSGPLKAANGPLKAESGPLNAPSGPLNTPEWAPKSSKWAPNSSEWASKSSEWAPKCSKWGPLKL